MKKQNWIYYTVIVGALPIIIRALTASFMMNSTLKMYFSAIDFVFFGLTLNLSNINEMISLKENDENIQKEKQSKPFWTIIILIFLSVNLGCLYVAENSNVQILNPIALNITSVLLCVLSVGFSYKLMVKLSTI